MFEKFDIDIGKCRGSCKEDTSNSGWNTRCKKSKAEHPYNMILDSLVKSNTLFIRTFYLRLLDGKRTHIT